MATIKNEIWLVRHGETAWSRTGQHTGITDIPLTSVGRKEAKSLKRTLRATSFQTVLVSPLSRAKETCQLAGYGDLAQLDSDLQEWNYGDFEGKTGEEIRQRIPGWTLWTGSIPCGESLESVVLRAKRVLQKITDSPGNALVFSHGDVIRILAALWLGISTSVAQALALDTASVSILGWEEGVRGLVRWNWAHFCQTETANQHHPNHE